MAFPGDHFMLFKILSFGVSGLVSLTLLGLMPAASQEPGGSTPSRKKGEAGPEGDLQRAYHLLRRLRADGQTAGRSDARIREWTDRATSFYREGIRALREENIQLAQVNAVIAHDLGLAIEHMRNATLYDRPDADLPPPPGKVKAGRDGDAHRELTKAYNRLREGDDGSDADPDAKYYRNAAGELYRAALRDFEGDRTDRAGELARAAEAMSRVCVNLGHAADVRTAPAPKAEVK